MTKKLKLSDLQQDPNNLNLGTERGRNVIKQSLAELGAGRSILVDKNGYIIAGNKTAAAALDSGIEDAVIVETTGDRVVVVQRTDLDLSTDPKAKKLAVADNRASELGLNWDIDALKVAADEIDISWLFTDEEIEGLDGWEDVENLETEGLTDEDEIPDPEDVETRVKKGDIWRLGRHRVMCGDSTVITDVERLMDGEKADLCFTSPPYGAGKVAKLRDHYVPGAEKRHSFYDVHDDDPASWDQLMRGWFNAFRSLSHCVICNVQMLADNKRMLMKWIADNSDDLVDIVVWDKIHAAPQMQKNVLSNTFEFCIIFGGNGSRSVPFSDFHGTIQNIVRISPRNKNEYAAVHGAVFPSELPEWFMNTLCVNSTIISDPFLGSGTTLIAAEKTGRTCYGMELSEKYCDVILKRWEDFTGQTAERI